MPLITVQQAVRDYPFARSVYYRLIREGAVKTVRDGRRVYIVRDSLDELIAEALRDGYVPGSTNIVVTLHPLLTQRYPRTDDAHFVVVSPGPRNACHGTPWLGTHKEQHSHGN